MTAISRAVHIEPQRFSTEVTPYNKILLWPELQKYNFNLLANLKICSCFQTGRPQEEVLTAASVSNSSSQENVIATSEFHLYTSVLFSWTPITQRFLLCMSPGQLSSVAIMI
jgi:hypothetical protein